MVFTTECSNHSNIIKIKGGYSSIGRAAVCGTVSFLFKSGYPPTGKVIVVLLVYNNNSQFILATTNVTTFSNEQVVTIFAKNNKSE